MKTLTTLLLFCCTLVLAEMPEKPRLEIRLEPKAIHNTIAQAPREIIIEEKPVAVPRKTVAADEEEPVDPEVPSKIVAPMEVTGIGTKADPYIFTTSTRCILELQGKTEGVKWDIQDAPTDTVILAKRYASFSLYENKEFQIVAYGGDVYSKVWFKIKSGTDPPGPTPNPDDPVVPVPDPIKPSKLYVVIVQKQLDLAKVPPAQLQIFTSNKIREYAATHCVLGADGKTPEFKIYQQGTKDNPTDLSRQSPAIQKGFKEAVADMEKSGGNTLIWIVGSNGAQGFSQPLPANEEETLKLLKKYGGE